MAALFTYYEQYATRKISSSTQRITFQGRGISHADRAGLQSQGQFGASAQRANGPCMMISSAVTSTVSHSAIGEKASILDCTSARIRSRMIWGEGTRAETGMVGMLKDNKGCDGEVVSRLFRLQ